MISLIYQYSIKSFRCFCKFFFLWGISLFASIHYQSLFAQWVPVAPLLDQYEEGQAIDLVCSSKCSPHIFLSQNSVLWCLENNHWIQLVETPQKEMIQQIFIVSEDTLCLATKKDIYLYEWKGNHSLKKIDLPFSEKRGALTCFFKRSEIWVSNSKEVFVFHLNSRQWEPFSLERGLFKIEDILVCEQGVFFLTSKGLFYRNSKKKRWQSILSLDNKFCINLSQNSIHRERQNQLLGDKKIFFDASVNMIWIYWRTKIYAFGFEKRFQKYEKLVEVNVIENVGITGFCALTEPWLGTSKGLFYLKIGEDYWSQSSAMDRDFLNTRLWCFSDQLFMLEGGILYKRMQFRRDWTQGHYDAFFKEPTVQQVQSRALCYAQLSDKALKDWKHSFDKWQWTPKITFSLSSDRDNEWKAYSNGRLIHMPDDRQNEFSLTCVWDFSSGQRVSSQTKLQLNLHKSVEYREKLLKEINKIYFERRKEQLRLYLQSHCHEGQKLSKMIQIDSLTARLDAYTGGWFSLQIQKKTIREGV